MNTTEDSANEVKTGQEPDFDIGFDGTTLHYFDPVQKTNKVSSSVTIEEWEFNLQYWERSVDESKMNVELCKEILKVLKQHEEGSEELEAKNYILKYHGFDIRYKDAGDNLKSIVDSLYDCTSVDDGALWNADPDCDHNIVVEWSGVRCTKCSGWHCF